MNQQLIKQYFPALTWIFDNNRATAATNRFEIIIDSMVFDGQTRYMGMVYITETMHFQCCTGSNESLSDALIAIRDWFLELIQEAETITTM